ncbi:MAG TPA: hypothetical protein VER96_29010 [Polyangiaceae bacterium]|nr:hypothetical protein [Polyangiaceae bacterium]
MGRQIFLVATLEDERAFLDFLRTTAPLRISEGFAPTIPELWIDNFAGEFKGHISYRIWNTVFAWEPTYERVGPRAHDPACIGWSYISNAGSAPVLEFDRSSPKRPGRLYWARDFSAPDGLHYDAVAFSRWVDRAFNWVRKYGRKQRQRDDFGAYWLPVALREAEASRH